MGVTHPSLIKVYEQLVNFGKPVSDKDILAVHSDKARHCEVTSKIIIYLPNTSDYLMHAFHDSWEAVAILFC